MGAKAAMRLDWEHVKESIMLRGLREKFSQPDFKRSLLNTGNEEIVEFNHWHDNEWGSCNCIKCRNIPGKNKLGKLLMQVRSELQK